MPHGYVVERRSFWPLWVGGIAAFTGSWALMGMAVGFGGDAELAIPLVGPWLQIGKEDGDRSAYVVVSGAGQALGVVAITAGLLIPRPRLVRADFVSVHVVPMLSANSVGARLDATF